MVNEITTEAMIYHGPGGCPKCGSLLTVIDSEMTIMDLNQEGHPTSEETIFKAKACCPNCGHKQEMMRWQGRYIPYSENVHRIKLGDALYNIRQRSRMLDEQSKGENPFAIESK